MYRLPPTTEPFCRIFFDETIVWIRADEREREKERHALRPHAGLETCHGPISNIPLRPRGNRRAPTSSADPNRLALNGLASSSSSTSHLVCRGETCMDSFTDFKAVREMMPEVHRISSIRNNLALGPRKKGNIAPWTPSIGCSIQTRL
jgi:hypothetical protein